MVDVNQKQLFANALPLLAVVLMASGIVVSTLPLESKRPVDEERVRVPYRAREDVEARLWQDPFTIMRRVKGTTPAERCNDARTDSPHHPSTLETSSERSRNVTVLPVMVPGGSYSRTPSVS